MSAAHTYTATISWRRGDDVFSDRRYSRAHSLAFDGGIEVPGSSSPLHVRLPFSDAHAIDPEEAFTASISSCHMLFFLDYAAQAGFIVDSYVDTATSTLGKTPAGKEAITLVELAPQIAFSGNRIPTADEIAALHHRAHEDCYIANAVTAKITIR